MNGRNADGFPFHKDGHISEGGKDRRDSDTRGTIDLLACCRFKAVGPFEKDIVLVRYGCNRLPVAATVHGLHAPAGDGTVDARRIGQRVLRSVVIRCGTQSKADKKQHKRA